MQRLIITACIAGCIALLGAVGYVYAPQDIVSDRYDVSTGLVADMINQTTTETRMLFVGDIMMDRHIRTVGEREGYDFFFSCVADVFSEYDLVIGNVEGPVTNFTSVSRVKTVEDPNLYKFTMSADVPGALVRAGVDIVSIDNNHMYDFGRDGLRQTGQYMQTAGLHYFGDPLDPLFTTYTASTTIGDVHFVSFNEFFGSVELTTKHIETFASSTNPIIVFAHWGDEYVPASNRVKSWARTFIDAGADVVIGAHPHVVQEFEVYNGAPIFYSLGNFIFDQYFSDDVQRGGAAEIVIKSTGEITSRFLPVYLDTEKRPCILQ